MLKKQTIAEILLKESRLSLELKPIYYSSEQEAIVRAANLNKELELSTYDSMFIKQYVHGWDYHNYSKYNFVVYAIDYDSHFIGYY